MTVNDFGNQLIDLLLRDPAKFNQENKPHELLQLYFDGFTLETLPPLLAHANANVRRAAVFIASELGCSAKSVVRGVVPLIHDSDPHVRWDAIECVMVCSIGEYSDLFMCVANELASTERWMRQLAMRLVSKGSDEQVDAARNLCRHSSEKLRSHERGLSAMLNCGSMSDSEVLAMLVDTDALIRRYGAIVSYKLRGASPSLCEKASKSGDEDVREFATEALEADGGAARTEVL